MQKFQPEYQQPPLKTHDVVIVGAGAGGVATAASLLKRRPDLDLAIIDPSQTHYYQPGWTMVGGGVFSAESTVRETQTILPKGCKWYRAKAEFIDAEQQCVKLSDSRSLGFRRLVVAPGLFMDWDSVEGLKDSLGKHGVTSNYCYELAPYTWSLIEKLEQGKALFIQPPMPVKCAGAPQKAMYLAADEWLRKGVLKDISVSYHSAGKVLFGVEDYVPELKKYIERYQINLCFEERLVAVDGAARIACFEQNPDGEKRIVERPFDMLHVVPKQYAPPFIQESGLANEEGWLDLNPETLQHRRYPSIYGLGDASGTPNAKTMAAVRKQAPVVAQNIVDSLKDRELSAAYLGYGSCPLTVERGKIVLAEFGYGGKLQPSFPRWLNDGTKATRMAWLLKAKQLPWLYWNGMLKGREWMAAPAPRDAG